MTLSDTMLISLLILLCFSSILGGPTWLVQCANADHRNSTSGASNIDERFPQWMSRVERLLLETSVDDIRADVVVAQDESGDVKTISEAIIRAPENAARAFVIVIKAGLYAEDNLTIWNNKTNLWILGEGIGRTIITGKKSVGGGIGTFDTASFAVKGDGFVARGMTFLNEAGPKMAQAVALLVMADRTVVYQCEVNGYQDTLYAHSRRQFYRECHIYGTVDFIFGAAKAVFQNCTIWARRPINHQKNAITAQKRGSWDMTSGFSFQYCQILAAKDLEPVKSTYPTYLGRPWSVYSRVSYISSYIGDHVDPRGWLAWDETSPTNELYYGEYQNFGPGADTTHRVKWNGMHVNMTREEAETFTVNGLISGEQWIPKTGIPYQGGLTT